MVGEGGELSRAHDRQCGFADTVFAWKEDQWGKIVEWPPGPSSATSGGISM